MSCLAGELTHFIVSNNRENVGLKTFAAFFQVSSFVGENVKHIELCPPVILCICYCLLSIVQCLGVVGLEKKKKLQIILKLTQMTVLW